MTQASTWGMPGVGPETQAQLDTIANSIFNSLLTHHSGNSRPPYMTTPTVQQGLWVDTTSAGSSPAYYILKYFDGTDDIEVMRVNATSNRVEGPLSYTAIPEPETVASAATANIGATKTAQVLITGTTTITSFGTVANQLRFIRFGGALTLTHNATSLILPSGSNITTAAGDTATAFSDSSGNWRIFAYQKADGNPVISVIKPLDIRQTVYSGPVDSSGLPSFGGSTGGTTVTASGTIRATAANGFDASGPVDRLGSITNPSWTGLSTNGMMYLYLDIDADGTCTPGSITLAPSYRWGGADVVTNGQFTYNIQEMIGKAGNGTTASQVYRVFVGQVSVASNVVTAIVWYALNGRYNSGFFSVSTNTTYNKAANIGVPPEYINVINLYRLNSSYVPRIMNGPVNISGSVYGAVVGATDRLNVRALAGSSGVAAGGGDGSFDFGSNNNTSSTGEYCLSVSRPW